MDPSDTVRIKNVMIFKRIIYSNSHLILSLFSPPLINFLNILTRKSYLIPFLSYFSTNFTKFLIIFEHFRPFCVISQKFYHILRVRHPRVPDSFDDSSILVAEIWHLNCAGRFIISCKRPAIVSNCEPSVQDLL